MSIDILGLIGHLGAFFTMPVLECDADLSPFTFGMRQVARAAVNVYRDERTRVGLETEGNWVIVGICVPFQHVERIVPDSVIDGLLLPEHTTHLFRFHSGASVEAGDILLMRVGNYPRSLWLVDGAGARTTWQAGVLEVGVDRMLEAEAILAAQLVFEEAA